MERMLVAAGPGQRRVIANQITPEVHSDFNVVCPDGFRKIVGDLKLCWNTPLRVGIVRASEGGIEAVARRHWGTWRPPPRNGGPTEHHCTEKIKLLMVVGLKM